MTRRIGIVFIVFYAALYWGCVASKACTMNSAEAASLTTESPSLIDRLTRMSSEEIIAVDMRNIEQAERSLREGPLPGENVEEFECYEHSLIAKMQAEIATLRNGK